MTASVLNIDDIQWKDVPIKYCEFKRASKEFIALDRSEIAYIVENVSLKGLSGEDKNSIARTMAPTLDECLEGSRDTRRTYLTNLMKLIVFRYRLKKVAAMRSSGSARRAYEQRAHDHYEALRDLKEALILGRSLLESDMPQVNVEDFPDNDAIYTD